MRIAARRIRERSEERSRRPPADGASTRRSGAHRPRAPPARAAAAELDARVERARLATAASAAASASRGLDAIPTAAAGGSRGRCSGDDAAADGGCSGAHADARLADADALHAPADVQHGRNDGRGRQSCCRCNALRRNVASGSDARRTRAAALHDGRRRASRRASHLVADERQHHTTRLRLQYAWHS